MCILYSFHLDHCGALPWFLEKVRPYTRERAVMDTLYRYIMQNSSSEMGRFFMYGTLGLRHLLAQSLVLYFAGPVVRLFAVSLVRWFAGSVVHWFDGSLVRWFSSSLVCWFSSSLNRWFSSSLVR